MASGFLALAENTSLNAFILLLHNNTVTLLNTVKS